jgi:2-amino-4-hydroxy-6-hydroxymethyldihydropteridine diphosphokinase
MSLNTVVVSLGSNISPRKNINAARKLLASQFAIIRESRFERTRPVGLSNQPDFINGVVLLKTSLPRKSLKIYLRNIEDQLGRTREGPKFGPRTIDLDIVVWNSKIVDHDYFQRDFLKAAVCEVLPYLKSIASFHPLLAHPRTKNMKVRMPIPINDLEA